MAICRIKQPEIFSSGLINDNLDPVNAPTSANLEEDLNYIRSVFKKLFGTPNWYDVPQGNMREVLDAFPVQHYVESDDPTKIGYHKDIIADSTTINNGDLTVNTGNFSLSSGSFTISSGLSASLSVTDYLLNTNSGSYTLLTGPQSITASTITATLSGNYTLSNGTNNWLIFSPSEYIQFNGSLSSGNLQVDFQQGYTLYSDNVGPLGEAGGTRLWLNTQDSIATGAAHGVVIGPRVGAGRLSAIRLRALSTYVEGGSGGGLSASLRVRTNANAADANQTYLSLLTQDSYGLVVHHNSSGFSTIAAVTAGTITWNRAVQYFENTEAWSVKTKQYLEVYSDYGYIRMGPYNNTYAHFFTDRSKYYFSTSVAINGSIIFYNVNSAQNFRMYMGGSYPVTPQEGDIWFVV